MKKLAIIPARSGSKRIPGKNTKNFLGKPIITYSIQAAISSKIFDKAMVSTDSPSIAGISKEFGADVPFLRSEKNATDEATTLDVIKEVLLEYKSKHGLEFDFVCCIYPTAPLIKIEHLNKGYELMREKAFSSVFPVIKYSHPVWRGFELIENKKTQMLWPKFSNKNSQLLKNVYHDAGQWYWLDMKIITNSIFTNNSGAIVLKQTEAQDIDNDEDWEMAELKYKLLNK